MANYTFSQLQDLWIQAGGSPIYAPFAAAIAMAESGGRPDAVNTSNSDGSIDRGLWQVNSVHGKQSTTDPFSNAKAAVAISKGGTDWRPWCTAWSNGACGGTFLGAGAPVLKWLPGGTTNTGTVPTAGTSNSQVNLNDPNLAAQILGKIFSILIGGDYTAAVAKIGANFRKFLYYVVLINAGVVAILVGIALLIFSTRTVKSVVSRYTGASIDARASRRVYGPPGDINVFTGEPLPEAAPVAEPPPAAPEQPALPRPLFAPSELDAGRRARLAASEDDIRTGLVPEPRRRALRRKTRGQNGPFEDYTGRHRA